MKLLKLLIILITLMIIGCATQRYGRMQHVTEADKNHLNCQGVDIEIEKTNQFLKEVTDKDNECTGRDVLAFLGDFGIGNSMEVSDAV